MLEKEGVVNSYTQEPLVVEDSPDNLTIERDNGEITRLKFYKRNGAALEWECCRYSTKIRRDFLMSGLKRKNIETIEVKKQRGVTYFSTYAQIMNNEDVTPFSSLSNLNEISTIF